jgi:hypothetical protein
MPVQKQLPRGWFGMRDKVQRRLPPGEIAQAAFPAVTGLSPAVSGTVLLVAAVASLVTIPMSISLFGWGMILPILIVGALLQLSVLVTKPRIIAVTDQAIVVLKGPFPRRVLARLPRGTSIAARGARHPMLTLGGSRYWINKDEADFLAAAQAAQSGWRQIIDRHRGNEEVGEPHSLPSEAGRFAGRVPAVGGSRPPASGGQHDDAAADT